jgi:cell division protease FtsH
VAVEKRAGALLGTLGELWREWRQRWSTHRRERRRRGGGGRRVNLSSPTARLFVLLVASLGLLVGAFAFALSYLQPVSPGRQLSLNELMTMAGNGQVATSVMYDFDHRVAGTYVKAVAQTGARHPVLDAYWTEYPTSDSETPALIERLSAGGATVTVRHQTDKEIVQFVTQYLMPLVILANLFALIFIATRGGAGDALGGIVQFSRIGKRKSSGGERPLTFADVAGADSAVSEMREVRDYLRDPARFAALGAQPPKGVLLFGPPGCGKTLMARAVAGEADAPFFSISGAEFVESLVGVGAARVRDLFRQVRQVAPAIVFIDELDAAGRRRGGVSGGQEEREQTLNQLLIEMDGFEAASGIVVIGATNRPDILDPALLRPGRFDRQVTVEPPDIDGRREILELHARSRPVAADVQFEYLARRTPGFTGADLANVINEAALLSVRLGKAEITQDELEEAVQRVLVGPQRRGHLLTADERRRAACHESGHALVSAAMGRLDSVQRISIVARGRSLGMATGKGLQERALFTRSQLRAELTTLMAGCAAEELMLGEPSSGAEDDLIRATELAQVIAGRYGMSERLGRVHLVRTEGGEFLGGPSTPGELTAGPVLMELHQEVRRLMDESEATALDLLQKHRAVLVELTDRLEEQEMLEGTELETALEPVRPEMNLVTASVEPVPTNGRH